ncbi:hypothetical protein F5H01DRAFT_350624 [Linnemannia elongata]|nr:hypothetical protein F5H01DRAFT_350624 [Linnemannia elongata]
MAFRKPAPSYDPRPGKDSSIESKDVTSNSLAFLTHSMPSRHRSGSTASTRSSRSTNGEQQQQKPTSTNTTTTNNTPLNPTLANNSSNSNNTLLSPLLPRNSSDNNSTHSKQSHHHIRLPSFLRRRKHSSASATTESPPSSTAQLSLQQHTVVMVPTHDIHIKWPHPVPSGNAFIAGTWSVPGHGPWEKLPMTRIEGTDSFEIHLDVQEIEDISDYLDEDGYLHHELLDHHHPHDHSHQGSPPLTPTSTTSSTTTHVSRRKRISRFFGRARSSSSASTTSSTNNKDLHIDLPHHHQSKDGTYLPLAREYRYQFKFVIDDEWKCDHDRAQVQDSHGHWNHELSVELVEQLPAGSVGGRSRSSSLQSQHGPQVSEQAPINKPLPIPHPTIITTSTSDSTTITKTTTSIIVSPAEEDEKDLTREVTENVDVESAPVPASSSTTISAAAPATAAVAAAIPTSTTTRRGNSVNSKDTYEAVLIFDETDDLSDGEGGHSKRQQVVESDDEDEEFEDNNINNIPIVSTIDNNSINNENATEEKEIVLLGEGEDAVKAEVTPQQDDHASLSPADQQQQDNCPSEESSPVVIKVSAANAADDATANPVSSSIEAAEVSSDKVTEIDVTQQVMEKNKEGEQDASTVAIEDVFVNSSSVAKPLPQLDEPSIIIPAESSFSAVEEESHTAAAVEEVAAPVPNVEAKVVEPEVVEKALEVEEPAPSPIVSSPAPTSVAIPASPDFSFESIATQSHLLSPDVEPEAFVLQAAVNLDEEDTDKDDDVSEVEELEPDVKTTTSATPTAAPTKAVLEVVTDPSVIAVATAAAAAAASATSTANDYSQVPSPPLTPSNLTSSKRDLLTGQIISVELTETEGEKQLQQQSEETFERSVYMTPRAETTITKHTTLEETTTTTTIKESSTVVVAVEDENATIDILDDKDLPASLMSNSSSSSSLLTLSGSQSGSRRSSNSSTSTKASSSSSPHREMVEHDKSKKSGPEQYPSLLWSFCKTTVVVSAAVVVLGLGLGRRRD